MKQDDCDKKTLFPIENDQEKSDYSNKDIKNLILF